MIDTTSHRRSVGHCVLFAALASFALALPLASQAEPRYSVSGAIIEGDPSRPIVLQSYDVQNSVLTVGRGVTDTVQGNPNFLAVANSNADQFGLHAQAYNTTTNIPSPDTFYNGVGREYGANAFARAIYDDVVIHGAPGQTTVQTAINVHVSGLLTTSSYPFDAIKREGTSSTASMSFNISVLAGSSGYSDGGNISASSRNGVNFPTTYGGMAALFNGSSDMKTIVMTLPVNVPFKLDWQLAVFTDTSYWYDMSLASFQAQADFGHTLTFATDKPVFDLPTGFTVDSAQAGIVGNTFTTPVPEPATIALWAVGLALLPIAARRRGRSDPAASQA